MRLRRWLRYRLASKSIVQIQQSVGQCDAHLTLAKIDFLFDENGVRYLYEVEQKVFVLQAVQDLIYYNRHARLNEDDTVIDICYLLCKIFRLNPVDIYHKALVNISRPDWGETVPSRELVKELFIPRGWKPRQLKKKQ